MVVLDSEGTELTTLSPVGALVWRLLPAEFQKLLDELVVTFEDVDPSVLRQDLTAFLNSLGEAGLVVTTDASS